MSLTTAVLVSLFAANPTEASFPPLPSKVSSFGAASCGDHVYVYGGHTGKTHQYSSADISGRFFRAPLGGGNWEELPGGPGMQGLAFLSHQGKLYRLGGMQPRNKPGEKANNVSLKSCAVYDPASRKWSDLPDLPEARSSFEAVAVGNKLFVLGGWNMQGGKVDWHGTGLVLDLQNPTKWQAIDQPFRRRALGAAVLGEKIYVIAGLGEEATSQQVDVYDTASGKWTKGPDFPGGTRNGFSPAAAVVSNRLYASGPDGKVHRLTADGSGWEQVTKQQVKRSVHRVVPGPTETLIVLGGAAESDDASRRVEVISLKDTARSSASR